MTTIFLLGRCSYADTDFSQSSDPTAVPTLPNSSQPQIQNPPGFSWSQYPGAVSSYEIEIRSGARKVAQYLSQRNWLLPDQPFAVGRYSWRVRPAGARHWSTARPFVIDASTARFVVPDNAALRDTILLRVRPRSLAADFMPAANWTAAMREDRQSDLDQLATEVDANIRSLPALNDRDWPLTTQAPMTPDKVAQIDAIRTAIYASERQIEAASLLFALTGAQRYFDETARRADQLAALDPNGPTSYANQDQAARAIAMALIRAVDVLGPAQGLDQARRARWLHGVELRGNQIYQDLVRDNNRIDQYPYDSHAGTNLGYLAAISALALGELPVAERWFEFSFRDYANWIMAWSGPEGGFANGTAYAQYAAYFAIKLWPVIGNASGVDLFAKPWSRGFAQFLMEFVPPGSTRHVFGDEHELAPDFAVLQAYIAHFSTPAAAWYYRTLPVRQDPLALLASSYPLPVNNASDAQAPANAAWYASIGWVALHSDLADPQRSSLYFKSSRFGSFSHSHGDQNGFTLSKAGVPLLIEAGWEDWYGSPLSAGWYRQTRAHNAVTIDGGIGQVITGYRATMADNGQIDEFRSSAELDFVQGQASAAYGSQLTRATRRIWYLRKADAFVIEDRLSAEAPHRFEWNLHAAAPINYADDGSLSISSAGQSVCVVPLLHQGARFEKQPGAKPQAGKYEEHTALISATAVTNQHFLVLLDVGCKHPPTAVSHSQQPMIFTVGDQSVTVPD